MYKFTALLSLLLIAYSSFAQNKASIKGTLVDSISKSPLEFATIAVVSAKDTALISYTLSDKKGGFSLTGLPVDKPSKLIISYVGYNTISQNLDFKTGAVKDFGTIAISNKGQLNEVVIEGERSPIVIKKDTIEFNTETFKTRPNAVVEELLKKLPGVQVNTDGSILVNGKPISKLLIDGKEFFGTDPKVATKNLDADMIDKIQLYDDRENDPDHKISATKVNKIINLKLKSKIKKSTLGKIYGGGGTRDRYEAGGILSNFRDTLQVSLIGLANNLNKTGFSSQELYSMGGFNRSGGDQIYNGTFGGRGWGGKESVASAGFNINNDYGKKLKMNLVYFYTNTKRTNNGNSFSEQFLPDTKLTSSSTNNSDQNTNKHALGGLVEWNPDTLNRFRYQPKLDLNFDRNLNSGLGNTFNTLEPRLTDYAQNGLTNGKGASFSHSFTYNRRLKKKGESINVSHSLNLNNGASDSYSNFNIISYTSSLNSEIQDRFADNDSKSSSASISIDYNYPITKKFFTEINTGSNYLATKELLSTFDKNTQSGLYDLFLSNQSNDLTRHQWTNNIRPQLGYNFTDDFIVKLGLNVQLQNVTNKFNGTIKDINNSYFDFLPTARFDGPGFSIDYNKRIEQPSIYDIQPITREYSQLYKFTGNPELKPRYVHDISGNYYKYINSKQININGYTGINISSNNVIQKTTIDDNGVHTSTRVNRSGGIYGYMGANFGKQFKKSQNWQIGLNTNLNVNIDKKAFLLNADEGMQYNYYLNLGQGINFNYKQLLDLNMNYNFNKSITEYKDVDYNTVNTYTHSISSNISLRWPKKIIIDGNYSYNYNPQVANGFQKSSNILNLAISVLMLKKDRGQLKLSVYDLLDQNIATYRYASTNQVSTGQQEILKRYFLLNYQYKLNIFKGK